MKYMARPFEVKAIADDGTFEGYGSVFHVEDSYRDVVAPGAFSKSLAGWRAKGSLPPVLWQHSSAHPVGPYLEMKEDGSGLWVRGQLLKDDVALAKEAYALMKAKAVTGLSIGYRTIVDEFDRETGITTLKELDLWEVSIVTFPANDLARIENVKSITTVRDFEEFLRESGFSKSEALRIASNGFERRESAAENAENKKLIEKSIHIFGG
ncbi:prohead peptidase. Unknown type peptidase. MEROPS family U35 [Desulfopila aestuarii DSM 18488]|uniref:Prohead serine protease domain-containing protein n=2 Tax=Desulfopila aestuarii TaxID=231440 RepID=A0A1M7YJS2_9BACT|nr:prohead peptidase. Unknown type peptidase. MEROPS family U35 [Desulfopila aestuarii DSM 18488]